MKHVTERGHPTPALTVDVVILRASEVLLIRRGRPPQAGTWALPGGFVDVGERVEDAAVREAAEETGLPVTLGKLIGVYSDPDRDPRHHTVTVAFLATVPGTKLKPQAGTDAADARWFPVDALPELAFDHDQIVADALHR